LRALVKSLKIEPYVLFPGFQKNPYQFLKHAEVFLLTSQWEGFAHVVAEALACNTEVISMNCDFGPSEILQNGKFGDLVEKNNDSAFIETLKRRMHCKQRFQNKMKRADDFDVKKIVIEYENLFHAIAKRSSNSKVWFDELYFLF